MNDATKIDLLRVLLDADADYAELLEDLHRYAKAELGSEGGLPTYDEELKHMIQLVKICLCRLVLKKA